jgi:hypothetical protein
MQHETPDNRGQRSQRLPTATTTTAGCTPAGGSFYTSLYRWKGATRYATWKAGVKDPIWHSRSREKMQQYCDLLNELEKRQQNGNRCETTVNDANP